ncbi:MAG: 50S ribosomal protein L24 [Nitrospira sp.]
MHIKKDDKVIVITGKDKGKTGSVVKSFPKEGKVIVSGINVLKSHQKPRRSGEKGQIVEKAMPINVSNLKKVEGKAKEVKAKKKSE